MKKNNNFRQKKKSTRTSKTHPNQILDQIAAAETRKLEGGHARTWWGKPPPRPKRPRGPSPGADYTTVQLLTTFSQETGLSSGSIVAQATTNTLGSIAVEFGDFTQVSSFTSIFD
jgi:hypothetical protein